VADPIDRLTEREKQALRLIVQGHDAKSIARHLDLSVHTVNERLRGARRKLGVSSSREAARALLAAEGPQILVPDELGAAPARPPVPPGDRPAGGGPRRPVAVAVGVVFMTFIAALLLAVLPQAQTPAPATTAQHHPTAAAAERFLRLIDRGQWEESWRATTPEFRRLNTVAVWTAASEKARAPLGPVRSRVLASSEDVPAGGPDGATIVKFRTSFAGRADATETVGLIRQDGAWQVTGVYIE